MPHQFWHDKLDLQAGLESVAAVSAPVVVWDEVSQLS